MKKQQFQNFLNLLEYEIKQFENKNLNLKNGKKKLGTIYTPQKISDFIVLNILKIYFEEFFGKDLFQVKFNQNSLKKFFSRNLEIKGKLTKRIINLKILDPACGSGRFLLSIAEKLLILYKALDVELNEYEIKKQILQYNLYGNDIDESAIRISKIKLLKWLFTGINSLNLEKLELLSLKVDNLNQIFKKINIKSNFYNLDFLLEFKLQNFDIIVGNPPYIENKKISDLIFKKKLTKEFNSAYKLFDLSIIFLEKSLKLLKQNEGCLSFLITNKFLSADYGVKIREFLLKKTEIKEIVNISTLPIFHKTAAYPIILSLKKKIPLNTLITVKNFKSLQDFENSENLSIIKFTQNSINHLPGKVIPISNNINLVNYIYSKFKPMSNVIKDLKIIYRPFGFIKWAKHFKNVSENKTSERDLLLIGTGNVDRFHIKFDKQIKIAKNILNISYFMYNDNYSQIWKDLESEKLIFREIAKDLSWVYDPGVFANITGLYCVRIPSYNTDDLFCLLAIINSDLINSVFKTLFSTLHMAGGYLRFNGSFIRRLPIPNILPISFSRLGKILQFLYQYRYETTSKPGFNPFKKTNNNYIEKILKFYQKITNNLVSQLYLNNQNYKDLNNFDSLSNYFPNIDFKYINPRYNLPKYVVYNDEELKSTLLRIIKSYKQIVKDPHILSKLNKKLSYG